MLIIGPTGGGNRALGAPRLNDAIWLRGGTRDDIVAQVTGSAGEALATRALAKRG